jgi:hypothetical protein
VTRPPEGPLHRAPRPVMLWAGAALCALAVCGFALFLYRVANAVAIAYERAAETAMPVPDMSGGLPALLMAVGSFLAACFPIWQAMTARHRERMDQQARGQVAPPFVPSPPSGAHDDVSGPRPWENHSA